MLKRMLSAGFYKQHWKLQPGELHCPGFFVSFCQALQIEEGRRVLYRGMNQNNRAVALRKLEKIANKDKGLWYKQMCDYVLAYHLPADDRIWLFNKLKDKGLANHGKEPKAIQKGRSKTWCDEDGSEYVDYAHRDYEALYDEIIGRCYDLKPLVEKVRRIKPPQRYEMEQISRRIREGDDGARERLIEMYLRAALAFGLRWSKLLDVDLQETVGDALEGLVRAANNYSPVKGCTFSICLFYWVRLATGRGHTTHNPQISFSKNEMPIYVNAYCALKKWGCLECDRLMNCDKAVQKIAKCLNCGLEDARTAVWASLEPLSLENYLESAEHTISEDLCEDIREEEEDAPDYEDELSSYCVDAAEEAETGLTDWLLQEKLHEQMDRLNPREKQVLEYRNGIGCGRTYTLEEIGQKYCVSRERIRQIENKAMKTLRTESTVLKNYLSDTQSNHGKNMEPDKHQTGGAHLKKNLSNEYARGKIMNLSELLISYRTEHNLDKRKMAKLCEISENMVSRLEEPDNKKCPSSKVLLKLFVNMEISENDFMDVIKNDEMFQGMNLSWMWEERNEIRLLNYYHQMNKLGKEIALAQVQVLAESRKF